MWRVLADAGLTRQLAILIGINPLRSAKSAQWMKSHLFGTIIPDALIARMDKAANPAREGVRICSNWSKSWPPSPASPESTSWRRATTRPFRK